MSKRFVSVWFPHLITDWFVISNPSLRGKNFVVTSIVHGQMMVTAANPSALAQGIETGMVLNNARALVSDLVVLDEKPGLKENLLKRLALWSVRFTPFTAIDLPDGLILDASGCSHLWGGDQNYILEIGLRLRERGYQLRIAMTDTIGSAWALSRFGNPPLVIEKGKQTEALLNLPAASLRLPMETTELLNKLGLHRVSDFLHLPRPSLRRRFGHVLLQRIDQALGNEEENIEPVRIPEPYSERLNCLEPIITHTGIEIALKKLLEMICQRLQKEEKGLRSAVFRAYQMNGAMAQIVIETGRSSSHAEHLFKLFEIKLPILQPESGIELFVLEAKRIEDHGARQEKFWNLSPDAQHIQLTELLDRLSAKYGAQNIQRYIPDEHHWPERSFQPASSLSEVEETIWKQDRPRPLQMLTKPEPILVTAPIPDYPPMLFRYKGKLHKIVKADGPERIEQEWWIQQGEHRDYYYVEDEEGCRYWIFRLGHYDAPETKGWFLHGYFA
ncbi:MAG: Y-family DNA polymerase [Flavisolibacter sp.]